LISFTFADKFEDLLRREQRVKSTGPVFNRAIGPSGRIPSLWLLRHSYGLRGLCSSEGRKCRAQDGPPIDPLNERSEDSAKTSLGLMTPQILAIRNFRLHISPGSIIGEKKHKWVLMDSLLASRVPLSHGSQL